MTLPNRSVTLAKIRSNHFAVDDADVCDFVKAAVSQGLSEEETAELAQAMAFSGSILTPAAKTTDVPSSGGPASLSTLVCPLMIALVGGRVLKVSVPGKPAGAVDVLESLPGFVSEPTVEVLNQLAA